VILWADDTPAAYARLVGAGAPALAAPHRWLGRVLIAWTADPDGHPVQIVQHPAHRTTTPVAGQPIAAACPAIAASCSM
jgi:hypothetical protein